MTLAIYVPFSEINNGVPSTFEEFQKALQAFPRNRVLYLCSAINLLLRSNEETYDRNAHDALVRKFFGHETASRFLQAEGDVRVVIHRQQILFLMKAAILYCPEGSEPVATDEQFHDFGRILLMAADHLPNLVAAPDDLPLKFAHYAAQFIPIQEAAGFHRFDHKIARSYRMLWKVLPTMLATAGAVDIAKEFERVTQVPLLTFQSLILGALTKFSQIDLARYANNPGSYALNSEWFRSTTVPEPTVNAFLDLISATPDQFKNAFERPGGNWGNNDFTAFRDKPLFRDGDLFFLIDFAFLAEKFETAPFWMIHNFDADNGRRGNLHSFWGAIFERYGCSVLEGTSAAPRNIVVENPRFKDAGKGEVCDCIVICGTEAAILELKGATFTSRAKYGSDPQRLMAEMDAKLVQEPGADAKAVAQLKRAVELICQGEQIEGVDLNGVRTLYPLVVTRDDIGSTFAVNAFLQVRADELLDRRAQSKTVTPFFCVDAEDLERLSAYFDKHALTELLQAHFKASRTLGRYFTNPYFQNRGNEILQAEGLLTSEDHRNAWTEFGERAAKHLGLKNDFST